MGRGARRPASGAFTIVELLVVIAIIALLLSILLPSLRAAKEIARLLMCKANLRLIGTALPNYATSNAGYVVIGEYHISDEEGETDTLETILTRQKYVPGQMTDNLTDMPKGQTAFRCPSGVRKAVRITDLYWVEPSAYSESGAVAIGRRHQLPSGGAKYVQTWYGANLATWYSGRYPFGRWRVNDPGHDRNQNRKMRTIVRPSALVSLYDGIWCHNAWAYQRIHARHMFRRSTNVVFFDGHCETFDRRNLPFDGFSPDEWPIWRTDHQ
jgi:prepilin-type N-terminal cleavage/methylation domain-containing protein/prepilin-type processing-associated H-X9-DG protein